MTSMTRFRSPSGRISRQEFLSPFDEMFNRLWKDTMGTTLGSNFLSQGSYPKVNVMEYADRVEIEAAVPGMPKDAVSIELDGQYLTIRGEKNQREGTESATFLCRELKRSAFARSFRLQESMDVDGISASHRDGVLTIAIPRKMLKESATSVKKIDIT
tara:strand:- start:3206 stop:3679 length:474 start_codon:yes stop_codon:yes gene_type:complete